jgi:hypothetical protein
MGLTGGSTREVVVTAIESNPITLLPEHIGEEGVLAARRQRKA